MSTGRHHGLPRQNARSGVAGVTMSRPVAEGGARLPCQVPEDDRVVMAAAMKKVRVHGTERARHLRRDIYAVRAFAQEHGYRILFAMEGRLSQVLLSLHAIRKQTQTTRPMDIELAETRLHDRRKRGSAGGRER